MCKSKKKKQTELKLFQILLKIHMLGNTNSKYSFEIKFLWESVSINIELNLISYFNWSL